MKSLPISFFLFAFLSGFCVFAQAPLVPLMNLQLTAPNQARPSPTFVNPNFIERYRIRSIRANMVKGRLAFRPENLDTKDDILFHSHELFFNFSGNIEQELLLGQSNSPDTLLAFRYQYDLWNKLINREKHRGGKPSRTSKYHYSDSCLTAIIESDNYGETGNIINLIWKEDGTLSRREEYFEHQKLQTEYFLPHTAQQEVLDFVKETEIDKAAPSILIIYLIRDKRIVKEHYHTPFSDYTKNYAYDHLGRILAIHQKEFGITASQIFKYDEHGNLREQINATSGLPTTKIEYRYDQNGIFLNEMVRMVDGEVIDHAVFKYDFRY